MHIIIKNRELSIPYAHPYREPIILFILLENGTEYTLYTIGIWNKVDIELIIKGNNLVRISHSIFEQGVLL